jgi:hypothetical protein
MSSARRRESSADGHSVMVASRSVEMSGYDTDDESKEFSPSQYLEYRLEKSSVTFDWNNGGKPHTIQSVDLQNEWLEIVWWKAFVCRGPGNGIEFETLDPPFCNWSFVELELKLHSWSWS